MTPKFLSDLIQSALHFLGKKLDTLIDLARTPPKVKVEVDMGETSKSLNDAAKNFKTLIDQIGPKGSEAKAAEATIRSEDHLLLIARGIKETVKSLESLASDGKESFPPAFYSTLDSITTSLKDLKKVQERKIDLSDILPALTRLESSMKGVFLELKKEKNSLLIDLLHSINNRLATFKMPEIPGTFKIDDMQMRALSVNLGGGSGGGGGGGPSTNGVVYDGRKTVSVTNTAVKLATDQLCEQVFITALTTNTDVVCIGGSGVIFTEATRTGRAMNSGDSIMLTVHNLNKVWINATANDGVSYTFTA